jgi:hypothetical protein
VSGTEGRPAAEPEKVGAAEAESTGQLLASASADSGGIPPAGPGGGAAVTLSSAGAGGKSGAAPSPAAAGPAATQTAGIEAGAAGTARAAGAASPSAPATGAVGRRQARRQAVLGWAAATAGIAGVSWVLISLITAWTSYATLTITGWQMLTTGPHSARISFSVQNSGTGAATGCAAHVRLGNGQVLSATSAPINVGGTTQYALEYRESSRRQSQPAVAWATCGGVQTSAERVATIEDIGITTSHVRLTPGPATDTVSAEVHNLGSQEAYGCHAFARFTGLKTATYSSGPADVGGRAIATFSIGYAAALGKPHAVWAECYDRPASSDGAVLSTRLYLRSLDRSR